ncbi:MAG: Holliday junction resolvase RuvX [Actinomycetota bacterium]
MPDEPGVFLGIDPGTQRIGVAVSNPEATMAFPLGVLSTDDGPLSEQVAGIAREREAVALVVGLPRRLDGTEGPEASAAREFGEEVSRVAKVPVHMFDERFTTVDAAAAMRRGGVSERKQRGKVDKVAAALLLQAFLDSRQGSRP